jgi:hypothetical protein
MGGAPCRRTGLAQSHACALVPVPFSPPVSPHPPPPPHLTVLAQELGAAALSKRPTSCMLVLPRPLKGGEEVDEEYSEAYGQVEKKIKAAQVGGCVFFCVVG